MPIYTYECPEGHTWDEVRSIEDDTQVSEEPCEACMEALSGDEFQYRVIEQSLTHGRKTVAQVTVRLSGPGWTPKFYKNRMGK